MAKAFAEAMTEQQASDLEAQIRRLVRFRVAGRHTVAGKGIHLDVVDTQSGYKHRIHSRDHWHQVFNELVLLVEGAWEDMTLAAIQQLEKELSSWRKSGWSRATARSMRRERTALEAQREILIRCLTQAQEISAHSSVWNGPRYINRRKRGEGSIRQVWANLFVVSCWVDGNRRTTSARTVAEAEAKIEALKRGDAVLSVSQEMGG